MLIKNKRESWVRKSHRKIKQKILRSMSKEEFTNLQLSERKWIDQEAAYLNSGDCLIYYWLYYPLRRYKNAIESSPASSSKYPNGAKSHEGTILPLISSLLCPHKPFSSFARPASRKNARNCAIKTLALPLRRDACNHVRNRDPQFLSPWKYAHRGPRTARWSAGAACYQRIPRVPSAKRSNSCTRRGNGRLPFLNTGDASFFYFAFRVCEFCDARGWCCDTEVPFVLLETEMTGNDGFGKNIWIPFHVYVWEKIILAFKLESLWFSGTSKFATVWFVAFLAVDRRKIAAIQCS